MFHTIHGVVGGPRFSRVFGDPYISVSNNGGKYSAIARGGDTAPFFCCPHGCVLSPSGSGVAGGPDISINDTGSEFRAVARGRDGVPFLRAPDGGVLGPGRSRKTESTQRDNEDQIMMRHRARSGATGKDHITRAPVPRKDMLRPTSRSQAMH